jgi:cysteine sulfinate desulfinase/cysteine desulfurase-like protein
MHADNEDGPLLPIAELATVSKTQGVLFHTDARHDFFETKMSPSA